MVGKIEFQIVDKFYCSIFYEQFLIEFFQFYDKDKKEFMERAKKAISTPALYPYCTNTCVFCTD